MLRPNRLKAEFLLGRLPEIFLPKEILLSKDSLLGHGSTFILLFQMYWALPSQRLTICKRSIGDIPNLPLGFTLIHKKTTLHKFHPNFGDQNCENILGPYRTLRIFFLGLDPIGERLLNMREFFLSNIFHTTSTPGPQINT